MIGFGGLLRALDAVDGIERIRFTSPHPKDMRDDVIAAMAECPAVCEQLHLPLQSGSTRVLKRMRRTYSRERYLDLVGRIRGAMPDIALTTDVIVGFPGESEADFRETLEVVDEVGFDHAFTFVYSPRRGTEAAAMEDQVAADVKSDRIARLVDLVQQHAAARNAALVGSVQEVLVEGPSRTDPQVLRGRTRGNKTTLFRGQAAPGWDRPDASGEMPAPPHGPEGHTWKHSDAMLYRIVAQGWRDPYNKTSRLTMPPFSGALTPGEIRDVIDYLKTLWTPEQRSFQQEESEHAPFPPAALGAP